MEENARYGWESNFPVFHETATRAIRRRLQDFLPDASPEQIRAWDESIPQLQHEVSEILTQDPSAPEYSAILEYQLPLESRRPDVILLVNGAVVVIELKGKTRPSRADIDQAAAYGRDLRCYHRDCQERPVHVVLVPTRTSGYKKKESGVHIAGPDVIDHLVGELERAEDVSQIRPAEFLSPDSYRPLPTLVQAARELFLRGDIRPIHRARAATDPAVFEITRIIHKAATSKTRKLILLKGIPGAGKTLVGLRTAHAHFLDELSIPRPDGKIEGPAVFLSGNDPLVQVLQYELKNAGGGGRTFVRRVKDYVRTYSSRKNPIPPHHVLVFDEAQRAHDAKRVEHTHRNTPGFIPGKSEPELFIEFAERVPEWCVVLGLIGSGQEIYVGEEAGLVQWRHAIEGSANPESWEVYLPEGVEDFSGTPIKVSTKTELNLDTELRFHLAKDLSRFVAQLLDSTPADEMAPIAEKLEDDGYHLRLTRNLDVAKTYLRERYAESPESRFGLVASSKDKSLVGFGVPNDFQSTKRVKTGPWYSDNEDHPKGLSCRLLQSCMTEFGAQGLELDACLLAWGTDLIQENGQWSDVHSGRFNYPHIQDPRQLRINVYRVLLTRGRDGTVVFLPPLKVIDETYAYLKDCGFGLLD